MNYILNKLATFSLKIRASSSFHTTTPAVAWTKSTLPKRFLEHNRQIYPPQEIGEEPRPAVNIIFLLFFFTYKTRGHKIVLFKTNVLHTIMKREF